MIFAGVALKLENVGPTVSSFNSLPTLYTGPSLLDSTDEETSLLRGVYMRKVTLARVSYRNDLLISYRVYIMTGSFHISLFEGTLHVDKIHMWFKIANITDALPIPDYRQTDIRPKRVVVSRLREWNSRPGITTGVNSRRGDSRRHDILWWYLVNKRRAMRRNWSDLAQARKSPRCHVNTHYAFWKDSIAWHSLKINRWYLVIFTS